MEAEPNLDNNGPTSIIDPRSDLASFAKSELFKYFKFIFLELKENLPLSIFEIFTPRFSRILISLLTSIISGILEIITSLSVKREAHIT